MIIGVVIYLGLYGGRVSLETLNSSKDIYVTVMLMNCGKTNLNNMLISLYKNVIRHKMKY